MVWEAGGAVRERTATVMEDEAQQEHGLGTTWLGWLQWIPKLIEC
jgi:hypothetical protein